MRRSIPLLVALALAVGAILASTTGALAHERKAEAQATLVSFTAAGITAEIEFVDTGRALIVDGEASGLDPTQQYFSLIYSTPGHGATACAGEPSSLTFMQMVVGFWQVNSDGEGTLHVVKTRNGISPSLAAFGFDPTGDYYAPIGTFHSVSVRLVPDNFSLQACGDVIQDD